MPAGIIGLYGNVDDHRTRAIAWYRRQGFYLAPRLGLPPREGLTGGVLVESTPDELVFRGFRDNLAQHLAGRGHPGSELRTARAEYRRQIQLVEPVTPARPDLGYRLFARRVADALDPLRCNHHRLGPRPWTVFGWDPQLRRVCPGCQVPHLEAIAAHDAEDRCDGCRSTRADVVVSQAVLEDQLLIVTAGLCGRCRAGDLTPAD